jgi:hypothetical protein
MPQLVKEWRDLARRSLEASLNDPVPSNRILLRKAAYDLETKAAARERALQQLPTITAAPIKHP